MPGHMITDERTEHNAAEYPVRFRPGKREAEQHAQGQWQMQRMNLHAREQQCRKKAAEHRQRFLQVCFDARRFVGSCGLHTRIVLP